MAARAALSVVGFDAMTRVARGISLAACESPIRPSTVETKIAEMQPDAHRVEPTRETDPIVDLGPVDAVPVGEGRAYRVGDRTIAVLRSAVRELSALDDRCPYDSGSLADGIVERRVVICPRHGRGFELSTGQCLNDETRVQSYPVALVAGRIQLVLEPPRK